MQPRSAARAHAFVDDLDVPVLAEDDHRHLTRVLRLRPGDEVTVADGWGHWRWCHIGPDRELVDLGAVVTDEQPRPALCVAFALVKGDRPELVVQKLTELGVDRIVPFVAERSVVQWDPAKADRNTRRLARIAREAAMQSRRSWLPDVLAVTDFETVSGFPGAALADQGGDPLTLATPTVVVGPEGGWAPGERGAGLPHVQLGEHVLRAETAAITAGALLGAIRSRLVESRVPPLVEGPHGA